MALFLTAVLTLLTAQRADQRLPAPAYGRAYIRTGRSDGAQDHGCFEGASALAQLHLRHGSAPDVYAEAV